MEELSASTSTNTNSRWFCRSCGNFLEEDPFETNAYGWCKDCVSAVRLAKMMAPHGGWRDPLPIGDTPDGYSPIQFFAHSETKFNFPAPGDRDWQAWVTGGAAVATPFWR